METCFTLVYMLDSMGKSPCKRASSHPEIQEFLAFKIALQMIIHMDGAYSNGCSGIEHVARLQREETADVADELVHLIQHVGRIARLHCLSINVEVEMETLDIEKFLFVYPSINAGRLCIDQPMRWSVTRLCG